MSKITDFIDKELKDRFELYQKSPDYILEHYESEQQNIASYNGRQLLEMLQNADDAAKKAKHKKALIELSGDTLRISNNGEKFDQSGFKSLMYIHRSGKKMKPDTIGQKGLGFRSILSWAQHLIVESGEEQIAFSQQQAHEFLQRIYDVKPDLKTYLNAESGLDFPIATLRIPSVVKTPVISTAFDTSIIVQLKKNIQSQVKKQMKERISMSTMLFLNNLDEIELKCEGYHRNYARKKLNSGMTISETNCISGKTVSENWNILHDKGKHQGRFYELSIAWKDDMEKNDGNVYSFFETQSKFSFPGILHGTFELSADRNTIIKDPEGNNAFLIGKAAELMIKVAERITLRSPKVSYQALNFLNADYPNMNAVFDAYNLEEVILEKVKSAAVFPSVNNTYITASDDIFYYPSLSEQLFTGPDVDNLLIYAEEGTTDDFLEKLGVKEYSPEKLYKMVSQRLTGTEKYRYARMVHFLLRSGHLKPIAELHEQKQSFLPLFTDNRDQFVPWSSQLLMQFKEENLFLLPPELPVSILDNTLYKALYQVYQQNDSRYFLSDLEAMGIKEYNFIEIVSSLSSHYEKADSPVLVKELHRYLFPLFVQELGETQQRPEVEVSIPVLGKKKNVIYAEDAYFGKSHGDPLCERLYRFDQKRILLDFELFEIEADPEQLRDYFEWLGVENLPRLMSKRLPVGGNTHQAFADHVLRSLDFRKSISNYYMKFRDYHEFMKSLIGVNGILVSAFDDMDKILLKATTEDIFSWLKHSSQLKSILEENRELYTEAYVNLKIQDKVHDRTLSYKEMPSFIKWQFSQLPWMPAGKTGSKTSPDKCCLSRTITAEFSPFLERPSDLLKRTALKLDISPSQFENYLVNCGVHREISTFSLNTLYGLLLNLPSSDISRKAGPSIYREIISNFSETGLDTTHPTYRKFLEEGQVVCEMGGKRDYYPVKEARYIQTKKYGNNLLRRFPLVQLDRKRGPKKVSRIFGVEPLTGITFELKGEPKPHELNSTFIANLNRFKALVYSLRMDLDTRGTIKSALKRLKINLVSEIKADYIHNGSKYPMELEEFEFLNKKSSFYILVDEGTSHERHDIGIADAVAEILTDIIGTEEYRSFIRELYNTSELAQENLLIRELQLEDNQRIVRAKAELKVIDDIRLSFWRAFLHASNQKLEISDESSLRKIITTLFKASVPDVEFFLDLDTYSQLNEQAVQERFFSLFQIHKVKFTVFSKQFPELDFKVLLKNRFQDVKSGYRANFSLQLYEKLFDLELAEKIKFFRYLSSYDHLEYDSGYGFIPEMMVFFARLIQDKFELKLDNQASLFNMDEQIKENKLSLASLGLEIPDLATDDYEGLVLILFHETEALKAYLKQLADKPLTQPGVKINQSEISFGGEKIIFTNYQSLAAQILGKVNFTKGRIRNASTETFDSPVGSTPRPGGKGKRPVKFGSGIEEQVGFIGELLAFHQLKAKYAGKDNVLVNWVSENAYRAEVAHTSEAGKGCDIEIMEDGKVRYVEVKAVASITDGFKITAGEINLAQKFPDKYDLLIVENPLSGEARFSYIRSAFKFAKGEHFMLNNKMKVLNDSYRIKFKWLEEKK